MLPLMIPIQRRFDLSQIDSTVSSSSLIPHSLPILLTRPISSKGYGSVYVNGIQLTRGEIVYRENEIILLIPVGEVIKDYNRIYKVILKGFVSDNGLHFPKVCFYLYSRAKRKYNPKYYYRDKKALEVAQESIILLKNENNLLPLKQNSVLNCFGKGIYLYRNASTGAAAINPRWNPSIMDAIEKHSAFSINRELAFYYKYADDGVPDSKIMRRAVKKSDIAIIFITRHSGEKRDNRPVKGEYYLSDSEKEMIYAVTTTFSKVILILNSGYPIEMKWLSTLNINSILYTGYTGMLATYALVEILDGRVNPSGKLPDTYVWDIYDSPIMREQPIRMGENTVVGDDKAGVRIYYNDDIYVGYRYFDTFNVDVAFPFGFGLSYAKFKSSLVSMIRTKENISMVIRVKNIGFVSGKEAVQVYLAAPKGYIEKPAHILVGFSKTRKLRPNDYQDLKISVDNKYMASFDQKKSSWILEKGKYEIFIGYIGALTKIGEFIETSNTVIKTVKSYNPPLEPIDIVSVKTSGVYSETRSGIVELDKRFLVTAPYVYYKADKLKRKKDRFVTWKEVKNNPNLIDFFVSQMSLKELCKMNVCAGSHWLPWEDGTSGTNYPLHKYGLPTYSVSDSNSGLNISKANIGFPSSSMVAATFNVDLAYTVGAIIAKESLEHKISMNLGPAMNLHRYYLNGRHPEYYSEDPFLAGVMAGNQAKGLVENGVGCCYKHLFCNNSELNRKGSHSVVSERALRELYFRCFEIAFSIQKPMAVMTSYNALNGIYPAENADLIQGLLREEWDFDGFVMSDWNSYFTIDPIRMINAGNCWITPGGKKWLKKIYEAAKVGCISREILENNARWHIKVLLKLCSKNDM